MSELGVAETHLGTGRGEKSVQGLVSQAAGASGDIWGQSKGAFADLTELGQHLPEQGMQCGELSAQVDVTLKATAVGQCVQVRDLVQELLHGTPLQLQKLIHESQKVLL